MTAGFSWLGWVLIAFLSGAIPYSVLVGRIFLGKDIRHFGDGNPGATNVLRAGGGIPLLVLSGLLDGFKGLIPVGLAYFVAGISFPQILPVALAPVLGHAFSPFLGFKGGKAVVVTMGILSGLSLWEGPTVFGIMLAIWSQGIVVSGWIVMFALTSTATYFWLTHHDPVIFPVIAGAMMIAAWKHRFDLRQAPGIRATFKARVNALPIWRH